MKTFLPLLAMVSLLTVAVGCHHTTKKYYEEDRHGDVHREGHDDYDRHQDRDHDRDHDRHN